MAKFIKVNALPSSRDNLNQLSKKYDRRAYQVLDQAITFFVENGYDPAVKDFETPSAELKKLRNTLISFLRTQEKEILKPTAGKVDEMLRIVAREKAGMDPHGIPKVPALGKENAAPGKGLKSGLVMPENKPKAVAESSPEIRPERKLKTPNNQGEDIQARIERERVEMERDEYKKMLVSLRNRFTKKGDRYYIDISESEYSQLPY